jgi:hypothetical protein
VITDYAPTDIATGDPAAAPATPLQTVEVNEDRTVATVILPGADITEAPASPAPEPVAAAPAAPVYEGQKVGECTVRERLSGFVGEGNWPPPDNAPHNVFDMVCKVAPSAQAGDFIEIKGQADYGQKFSTTATMEWQTVRDLPGQVKMWMAPQMETQINDHLYQGVNRVQVNLRVQPV